VKAKALVNIGWGCPTMSEWEAWKRRTAMKTKQRNWAMLKSQRYAGIVWCRHEMNKKFCVVCKKTCKKTRLPRPAVERPIAA